MTKRLMLVAAIAAALAAPAIARADAVTEWNQNATTALMVTAAQGPQLSVPNMAMVHGAVYDAVNAIDGGHEGYLLTLRVARRTDSKEAAAATAAYRMLLNLVPTQKPALDPLYAASLAGIPDGAAKTRGIAVGELAAAVVAGVLVEAVASRTCVISTSVTPLVETVVRPAPGLRGHETAWSRAPPATGCSA